MNDMNHERFEELKDAYALGALPEDERITFEEYLANHLHLRAEVDELSSISGLLAFSPDEYEPPPTLRRSIMGAVEAEDFQQTSESPSTLQRLRSRLSTQRLALGAAAIVLVALLSWNVVLQTQGSDLQSFEMQSSGPAKNVKAEVVEVEKDRYVLMAENMPSMPKDETMQVWVIDNGKPKPAGTFRPKDGLAATPVTKPIQGADAVAVTVEPAGGSAQPTSDPVMQRKL